MNWKHHHLPERQFPPAKPTKFWSVLFAIVLQVAHANYFPSTFCDSHCEAPQSFLHSYKVNLFPDLRNSPILPPNPRNRTQASIHIQWLPPLKLLKIPSKMISKTDTNFFRSTELTLGPTSKVTSYCVELWPSDVVSRHYQHTFVSRSHRFGSLWSWWGIQQQYWPVTAMLLF